MSPETVISTAQGALEVTVALVLVLLLPALAVGLLVSLFQAATQINEMTLSFIPKLLVTFAALLVAGPWMLSVLVEFSRQLFESVPFLIG